MSTTRTHYNYIIYLSVKNISTIADMLQRTGYSEIKYAANIDDEPVYWISFDDLIHHLELSKAKYTNDIKIVATNKDKVISLRLGNSSYLEFENVPEEEATHAASIISSFISQENFFPLKLFSKYPWTTAYIIAFTFQIFSAIVLPFDGDFTFNFTLLLNKSLAMGSLGFFVYFFLKPKARIYLEVPELLKSAFWFTIIGSLAIWALDKITNIILMK